MQVEVSNIAAHRLRVLIERGYYRDEQDALEAAVEVLWAESEDADEAFEDLVAKALDDVAAGRVAPLSADLADEIARKGRERLAARTSSHP